MWASLFSLHRVSRDAQSPYDHGVDFDWSPELQALRAEAEEVADKAVATYGVHDDSWINGYSREFSRELGQRGWIGMASRASFFSARTTSGALAAIFAAISCACATCVVSNVPAHRYSMSGFAAGQSAASRCASMRDFSDIRRSRASGSTTSVLSSPPMMMRPARVVRA